MMEEEKQMKQTETPFGATSQAGLSRRGFLGSMAATALGAASLTTLAGCSQPAASNQPKEDGDDATTALASGNAAFAEGTYTSTQHTPYAIAEVTCTFDAAGLTSASYAVTATSDNDYFPLFAPALEQLCETVAGAGKTAGVDAVSGATFCSNAILDSIDNCTLQALEVTLPRPEQLNPQQAGFDAFNRTCDKVFSPIKLGIMELPNRVVKSAGSGVWADANKDKLPVAKELYGAMAENGVALNLLAGGNLSGMGILPDSLDKTDGTVDEALAVDAALVKQQAPDAVVVATGGVRESRFSGANVFAAFLVSQGKAVTVLNEGSSSALDRGQSGWFKSYMLPYLRSNGVQILSGVTVESVDGAGVTFKTDADLEKTVPCDSVVELYDMQPNTALADELEKAGVEVYTVGDAAEPRNIQHAVTTGNLCAHAL